MVWARNQIGRDRARYEVPADWPPKLQALVLKVDAIEGTQVLGYSGSRREQMIDARRVGGIKAFPDWFVLT